MSHMKYVYAIALFITIQIAISLSADGGETGQASYYHDKFHGRPTASEEPYDKDKMTAAHRTQPFYTLMLVEHLKTHQTVTVKINDRGPFIRGRIIDLSRAAAEKLGIIADGHAEVYIEVIQEF